MAADLARGNFCLLLEAPLAICRALDWPHVGTLTTEVVWASTGPQWERVISQMWWNYMILLKFEGKNNIFLTSFSPCWISMTQEENSFFTKDKKSCLAIYKSFQKLQVGSNPVTNTSGRARVPKTQPPIPESWKARLMLPPQDVWEGRSVCYGSWAEAFPFSTAHLPLPVLLSAGEAAQFPCRNEEQKTPIFSILLRNFEQHWSFT